MRRSVFLCRALTTRAATPEPEVECWDQRGVGISKVRCNQGNIAGNLARKALKHADLRELQGSMVLILQKCFTRSTLIINAIYVV